MSYRKWLTVRILILSLVVLALVFGITFFTVKEIKLKRESDIKAKEINAILSPIREERDRIEVEISTLTQELKTGKYSAGTIMFMATDTDKKVYNELYTVLRNNNYTGLIAIGDDYLDENNMTIKQLKTLKQVGYDFVLKGDKDTDFESLNYSLNYNELGKAKAVYMNGEIDENTIQALETIEINTIIKYGDDTASNGIDYVYKAYGYKEDDFYDVIDEMVKTSESLVITVGYMNQNEIYDVNSFNKLLNQINGYTSYELVRVGGIDLANIRCSSISAITIQNKLERLEKLDELSKRLDQVLLELEEKSKEINKR